LAAAVVIVDQLTKAWITSTIAPGEVIRLIGDELRLIITYNTGGLFGLFRDQALVFAAFSAGVMALNVVFHARSTASRSLSVTLGLLLGGAIGNFIDRVRLGHVIDFVDGGLGSTRFYTFNVADMAVTASVLLLLALSVRSSLTGDGAPSGRPGDSTGGELPDGGRGL
jgi:signal peptidase II